MMSNIASWIARCKAILNLGEYEIRLELDPELQELGLCLPDPTYQTATIWLRDPRAGEHQDWRRTLLHELVHVRMGGALGTAPGTEERSALERGVEMMTRVLYKMMVAGAPERELSGMARMCARTIETAREGNEWSMSMGDGARIAEIAMQLGGMELPEEAKPLVQELIGLAAGGGGGDSLMPPEKDPPQDPKDPMMAADPEPDKMYRGLAARVDAMNARFTKIERAQIVALARAEMGEKLTPIDEREIAGMAPSEASAYLKGLKRSQSGSKGVAASDAQSHKAPKIDTVDLKSFLKPGEDAEKVKPEILEVRAALARKALPQRGN